MAQGAIEQYERVDFIKEYGVVPLSIWDTDNPQFSRPILAHLRERRGESTRENTLSSFGGAGERTAFTATASYFNPFLCRIVYSSYCPEGGRVFDPFASVVRPYVAQLMGFDYTGCEVRPDEAEKIASFLASSSPLLGDGDGKASVLNIDCREFQGEGFDLVFTCPPYWNLEKYSDIPADLSNVDDYESFLYQMSFVFDVCRRAMSPNAYCCFVVSDFRDYSEGRKRVNRLVPFVADMIHAGERSGLCLYDKVILRKPLGTAPARTKLWNNRKTVRIHEELLVFTRDRA